jgi:hypothetical protein
MKIKEQNNKSLQSFFVILMLRIFIETFYGDDDFSESILTIAEAFTFSNI